MVLAAGLGTRMRPLTDHLPKPLVPLKGRPLIDHVLDRIAAAGIASAVVNVHHHADLLIGHLARRTAPRITISDERDALLDTGGGVRRAMPLLGAGPFFVHNSDSVWIETATDNLSRHATHWRQADMDGLLLLAPTATSIGYGGRGDFALASDGRIARRAAGASAPFVFAGVSILHPRIMDGAPEGRFSLNASFDQAIARRRLFGLPLEGLWMHVGTPEAIVAAERAMDGAAVG
jgi:MurNAc alpha-1-phosphate uridylyltransferase